MKVSIGSVSEGTLKARDLIDAFGYELQQLGRTQWTDGSTALTDAAADMVTAADAVDALTDGGWLDVLGDGFLANFGEAMSGMLEGLTVALSVYAPPFIYFGTAEGDGANFGFWPDSDALQEAVKYESETDEDGDYILVDDGLRVSVSDHGNITVSVLATGDVLWSAV